MEVNNSVQPLFYRYSMELIIIQVILVITNSYIAVIENKRNIYIVTFLFNLLNLIMYLFKGDITTVTLYVLVTTRSLIYIFKDRVIQYNIIPIGFILLQIILGILTMTNYWQIISISVSCFSCYYLWYFDTTQKLRAGNVVANTAWAIYNIVNGLYIASISRFITIAVNGAAYIKNLDKSNEQ